MSYSQFSHIKSQISHLFPNISPFVPFFSLFFPILSWVFPKFLTVAPNSLSLEGAKILTINVMWRSKSYKKIIKKENTNKRDRLLVLILENLLENNMRSFGKVALYQHFDVVHDVRILFDGLYFQALVRGRIDVNRQANLADGGFFHHFPAAFGRQRNRL